MAQRHPTRRWRDLLGAAAGAALAGAGVALYPGSGAVTADVGTLPAPAAPPPGRSAALAPVPAPDPTRPAPTRAAVPVGSAADRPAPRVTLAPPRKGFVPTRLDLPAIDLRSDVVPVAARDGVLDVPADPRVLGWWDAGARPGGELGAVVLDGHLDSRRFGRGPLARVVQLRPGDRARLTGAGGARAAYEVVAVRTYAKAELPAAELFAQSGPERLVLVTCGGRYDRDAGGWDSNIVIVMQPVAPE